VRNNTYGYNIDFEYFNKLKEFEMYGELIWIINHDGRLIDRKLFDTSITLQENIYTLYLNNARSNNLKFLLHKAANKISLLEKYITLHFDAEEESNIDKIYLYEDKMFCIEKELLEMASEEKQFEKRYNYLKQKNGEDK
tara:strand:+ start:109 stop:525 length:417 start_codon:yes stop_codon:yes gene_type:complete